MKLFLSEYRHDYSSYTFGYTIYGLYESREDFNTLYAQGFLPYTGNLNLTHDLYYKSRGLRVDLNQFSDTSENRRVHRKTASLDIQLTIEAIENFTAWSTFFDFANRYSEQRIGEDKMPPQRITYITERKYLSHIITFTAEETVIGYVLAAMNENMFHYWFAFYDTSFLEKNIPLGKWLMWRCIHFAKEQGCAYIYLGNGYRETSLYKTRDFKAVEYFNGTTWSPDIKEFQRLCISDNELKAIDQFKQLESPDEWLDQLK